MEEIFEENPVKKSRKNLEKWHRFQIISPTQSILRGNYSITDKCFKILSRGRQASAASAIAIVYAHLLEPRDWTPSFIDRVLEDGDRLFRISQARHRIKDDVYMTPNLLEQQFFVGDYKCKICIEVGVVCGNVTSEAVGAPNFKHGLRIFLDDPNFGILTSQDMSVAIWNHQHCGYFYLDPAPVDEQGKRNSSGFACIIRTKDIESIFKIFIENLKYKNDSRYSIDKISVMKIETIDRGKYGCKNVNNIITNKKVTPKSINLQEIKPDCTKVNKIMELSQKDTKIVQELIRKIPLKIEMTNNTIEAKFGQASIVDQNLLNDRYTYDEVKVNIPSTFKAIATDLETKVLHGWTHDASDVYKAKGAQTVANCVMAIVMKKVHPVKTWLRKTLDEILILGDIVYAQVKDEKPSIKTMTAIDLNDTRFKIEDNKMIIDVDLLTVVGTVISKVRTVLNLKQGLEEFFIHNSDGILECSSIAVAIWMEENYYYLFDSQSCDMVGLHIIVEEKSKKGNENGELSKKKIIGKCCVIRFKTLSFLYEHLLKNLDSTKFKCRFTIRRVDVVNDIPGIRDWYSFQPALRGKSWILRGNINSDNETFDEHSRGVQGLAISVVTLVAAIITVPSNWSKQDVDNIIREGDAYYNWCIPPNGENEDDRKTLSLKNLKKILYYKKCKVVTDIKESCVIGDLTEVLDENLKNLNIGINEFFENYQFGILEVYNKYFAIWKYQNELKDKTVEVGYYLFCDKPWANFLQEIQTENNNVEEFGCVLRFINFTEILVTLKEQLEIEDENKSNFFIHEIKVISVTEPLTDEEIEIDKTTPIKPELRAYTAAGENGAMLIGSFNQTNEILFKKETRNKQQAANALVTLSMTKLFDPHLWCMGVLDDILKMGNKLSDESSKNLMDNSEDDTENVRYYLLPSEINHNFFLGINQITVNIEEEAIIGQLNELIKSLEDFFNNNKMGVFRKEQIMLAIWKEENVYFTMDPRGQKNGNATVYWYIDISSLAEILLGCSEKSEGDFIIDGVSIENNYSTSERITEDLITEDKWYHFSKIDEGIWKLDYNIGLTDEIFPKENQGYQSTAICIMAIVFSKAYEPRYWSTDILDEITITGDILHSRSVARLGENKFLQSNEIISEFFIANRRIDLIIQDCVQCGTINSQSPKIKDIINGISDFFEKFSSGCVTFSGYINFAIWTYDNYFYYFKPGYFLMRLENVITLAKEMIINIEVDADFIISSVDVLDWNKLPPWTFDPSSAIRPSNLPPLNAYCRLSGRARAILRGSTHQASEIFSENVRGRQTAANCITCLAMSIIKNPITWTRKTLDEILAIGINLHRESLKSTTKIITLEPKDIIRIFHIGVNVLAADVEKATVSGVVTYVSHELDEDIKNPKKAQKLKSSSDKKNNKSKRVPQSILSPILLIEGLNIFFEKNNAGILVIGRYMVAIWVDSGVYFMYDPRPRNHEGLKDDDNNDGASCIVWFACIKPLFDLISINIDDDEKYSKFEICRVIIKTVSIEPLPSATGYKIINKNESIPIEESVCISPTEILQQHPLNMDLETSFERIDDESSVLIGSRHMSGNYFPAENRGFQSSAIAAVAVVVSSLYAPSTWTCDLINATLKYGDILHTDCARLSRTGSRTLSLSELLETFVVGDIRARVRVYRNIMAGITLEHDLTSGFELFFANNSFGIMHTANYVIPLIEHWGKFYFLDPSERNGFKGSFEGAACLIKCENILKLAKLVLQVCAFKEPVAYTLNAAQILDLHFFTR